MISLEQIKTLQLTQLPKKVADDFILKYHYSGDVMPRLTKVRLGLIYKNNIIAVLSLGWGTRPLHTIQKLFSSCDTNDYYEIGKMCLHDDCPRNSETIFLSKVTKWLKANCPEKKFLYTWADGIVGKVGYVYQAYNMLYGGYILTDVYVTEDGKKIHPRSVTKHITKLQTSKGIIKELNFGEKDGLKIMQRPNFYHREILKLKRVKGKQFRYILPLNKKAKNLIKSSNYRWSLDYPKEDDLLWKVLNPSEKEYINTTKLPFHINNKNITSELF